MKPHRALAQLVCMGRVGDTLEASLGRSNKLMLGCAERRGERFFALDQFLDSVSPLLVSSDDHHGSKLVVMSFLSTVSPGRTHGKSARCEQAGRGFAEVALATPTQSVCVVYWYSIQ
jgi:hypothetical protein